MRENAAFFRKANIAGNKMEVKSHKVLLRAAKQMHPFAVNDKLELLNYVIKSPLLVCFFFFKTEREKTGKVKVFMGKPALKLSS